MRNIPTVLRPMISGLICWSFLLPFTSFGYAKIGRATHQSESPQSDLTVEIKNLRGVVRDEKLRQEKPKQVIAAIKRLGELKAESAVDDLVSVLTFRQKLASETSTQSGIGIIDGTHVDTLGDHYPAIEALFEIGKPALPALSRTIASSDSKSLLAQNATYALMVIFRDNPREGVTYLDHQASISQGTVAAARLRAAAADAKKTWIRK